jgi:F-type H+-transporting ATPase subunit delta
MSNLVAKRYVKALLGSDDTATVASELSQIATAYKEEKFLSILASSDIKVSAKVGLIVSFVENCSAKTTNLVNLLAENKRLDIIPDIACELQSQLNVINNTYTGVIYTNKELSSTDVEKMEKSFAQKFNTNLTLTQNICDYDGVKVDIDGLGVEIGFSKERLKSQMINHILKAV